MGTFGVANRSDNQQLAALFFGLPHGLKASSHPAKLFTANPMLLVPTARPVFSIIIPTRDRPEQLIACLKGLTNLDFPRRDFETIVVDDGSVEPVERICQPFVGPINLTVLHQSGGGPGRARNHGAFSAKGEFLAFTDDDCIPEPDWLRKLEEALRAYPGALIGGRNVNALTDNIYSATAQIIQDAVYAHYNAPEGHGHFFASSNFGVPREKFLAVGGFPEDWPVVAAEDRIFCHMWRQQNWRLNFAADAMVQHRHALGFISFWRLFLRYGRGAYLYHRVRDRREAIGGIVPEAGFYQECIRCAVEGNNAGRALQILVLLATWQLANALGYFLESRRALEHNIRLPDPTPRSLGS